ncbi:MAG: tryptophan--tRNA ligase, partial [Actinomycetia bacterium]|nr:tryptophan--tRNA ligase [Actinomycetes bacterium]
REPEEVAEGYSQYGPLKADTAEAVIEMLRPIQARFTELATDPGETARLLEVGADKARSMAHPVLARARQSIGLTAR